ncbi:MULTISPECIES: ABC transporter permease [unclassified Streptomyces]|jgi:oligopeptide transport system permease protein|uniref:ABC transporter permease n=1 Tax=unclassified Streptomyces TaxID=2593676 RepID=UPI00368A7317
MSDTTQKSDTAVENPAGPTAPAPVPAAQDKTRSLAQDAFRDLVRNPMFIISAVLIFVILVIAAFPGLFTSVDPLACDLKHSMEGPSGSAWFGYNFQGCDVYSQTIYGTRNSVIVGVLTTAFSLVIGGLVGVLGGFFGKWTDALLSFVTNVFFGLPLLLAAIVILNNFRDEKGMRNAGVMAVVLTLTAVGWMSMARVMRGAVMQVKQADYVAAARSLGSSTSRMMFRHVLPNSVTPLIVVATISLGAVIGAEATLSFLGIGIRPPAISWGVMISEAQDRISSGLHPLLFPSGMLTITVLAFIMLGDAVRDAFDPKLR